MNREPIGDRARNRWRGILEALGIDPKCLTGKHGPCPICRAGTDRFRFDNREGRGTWICNACGAGDGVKLVMEVKGLEFKDAAREIERVMGEVPEELPVRRKTSAESREAMNRLWKSAERIVQGDPVARYLGNRGLEIPTIKSLRTAETARYQDKDGPASWHPAMVAMVVDAKGVPVNLHRTFLTKDGHKADVPAPRKIMEGGIPKGSCVRLSEPAEVMGIAEGLETAMSAAKLFQVPCWAALNTSILSGWEPPEGTRKVMIFGDNDSGFAGQAAAYGLAYKLKSKGIEAEVSLPPLIGQDWNDVVRADLVRVTG